MQNEPTKRFPTSPGASASRKPTPPADPGTGTFNLEDADDKPRITIKGYTLVRAISSGGQGTVFEAVHLATSRRVAVKILAGGALSNARERVRFEQEAKILAALDHPNIVRVIDRGTADDGSLFLVMDYLSGRSLSKYLGDIAATKDRGASRDPSEALRLFLKIADAVNAAHLRGIMHRDLKPANILIDDHNEPHILDFGLARAGLMRYTEGDNPEPVTLTGQFLGSLPWSSPEQANGAMDKIDIRTDVYSLGVILYQMLTGEFPYEVAGTMRDVLNNIITAEPPPPSVVLQGRAEKEAAKRKIRLAKSRLNPVIDAIVLKALAKSREERYQSAGELARDIGNYLSGRPTIAAGGREKTWLQRPLVWGTAAALLFTAGVSTVWLLSGRNEKPMSETPAEPVAMPEPAHNTAPAPAAPVGTPTAAATPTAATPPAPAGGQPTLNVSASIPLPPTPQPSALQPPAPQPGMAQPPSQYPAPPMPANGYQQPAAGPGPGMPPSGGAGSPTTRPGPGEPGYVSPDGRFVAPPIPDDAPERQPGWRPPPHPPGSPQTQPGWRPGMNRNRLPREGPMRGEGPMMGPNGEPLPPPGEGPPPQ